MERRNYWTSRVTRRRLLRDGALLGAATAALGLVGCGGDDGGKKVQPTMTATPVKSATPVPTQADPFANARRGGTYRLAANGDPQTLDPYAAQSPLTLAFSAFHYSRLFKYRTGPGVDPLDVRPIPDIASRAEPSPDRLKWSITLRGDVKFHNIAPVNGRPVTADDVRFSLGRLTASSPESRARIAYIDRVEYPEPKAVVFTLKEPRAAFLDDLADASLLFIMPREAENGFNPARTAIGSGPWIFDTYRPGARIAWTQNPSWYLKGFPLFNSIEMPIVTDGAKRLAMFLAGSTDSESFNADDVLAVKDQMKGVTLVGTTGPVLSYISFDSNPSSPWNRDPRVRQAISLALNRDALTEVGYAVKQLRAAGLEVKAPWHNIVPAGEARWWLDPRSNDQGPSAKYWAYDPVEAKRLLAAAGFPDGFATTYQYAASSGKLLISIAEAQVSMLNAIGIKSTVEAQDDSKYLSQTSRGAFTGMAFGYETAFADVGSYFARLFSPDQPNHGRVSDPELVDLTRRQQTESDEEKRKALIWDLQRAHGEKMYYVPSQAGAGTAWEAHQPAIRGTEYRTRGYGAGTESAAFRWRA